MARSIGKLAREILSALSELGEAVYSSPLTNRRVLAQWCWQEVRRTSDIPYNNRFYQTVKRLEASGHITVTGDKVELSPEAQVLTHQIDFEHHRLQKVPWDGIWRVVIWDIPEPKRTQRNRARRVLKKLHFAQIQQSIWVTPYPCREEIQALREEIGIDAGLLYVEATLIEGQTTLKEHFKLE